MTRRMNNPFAVLLIPFGSLLLAQVEEFPVAVGPPVFDKQPWIRGNLVVWQRYSANPPFTPGMLQWRDLSRLDNPVLDAAPRPVGMSGVVLGPTHLFWNGALWRRGHPKVLARPIEHLPDGDASEVQNVPLITRIASASRKYFVWEDRNPEIREDSWKILSDAVVILRYLFVGGTRLGTRS